MSVTKTQLAGFSEFAATFADEYEARPERAEAILALSKSVKDADAAIYTGLVLRYDKSPLVPPEYKPTSWFSRLLSSITKWFSPGENSIDVSLNKAQAFLKLRDQFFLANDLPTPPEYFHLDTLLKSSESFDDTRINKRLRYFLGSEFEFIAKHLAEGGNSEHLEEYVFSLLEVATSYNCVIGAEEFYPRWGRKILAADFQNQIRPYIQKKLDEIMPKGVTSFLDKKRLQVFFTYGLLDPDFIKAHPFIFSHFKVVGLQEDGSYEKWYKDQAEIILASMENFKMDGWETTFKEAFVYNNDREEWENSLLNLIYIYWNNNFVKEVIVPFRDNLLHYYANDLGVIEKTNFVFNQFYDRLQPEEIRAWQEHQLSLPRSAQTFIPKKKFKKYSGFQTLTLHFNRFKNISSLMKAGK